MRQDITTKMNEALTEKESAELVDLGESNMDSPLATAQLFVQRGDKEDAYDITMESYLIDGDLITVYKVWDAQGWVGMSKNTIILDLVIEDVPHTEEIEVEYASDRDYAEMIKEQTQTEVVVKDTANI